MSDAINTSTSTQAEVITQPQEQAPQQPAEDTPEADHGPEQGQTPTDDQLREAKRLLDGAARAYAKGVGSLAEHWIKAGEYCHGYYNYRRFVLGHKREAATTALKGRLMEYADDPQSADPSRLAGVYHVVKLLGDDTDTWIKRQVAYGKLLAMQSLVARDDTTEAYSVRPGVEPTQAQALFAAVVGKKGEPMMPLADVRQRVLELVDPEKAAEKAKDKATAKARTEEEQATVSEPEDAPTAEGPARCNAPNLLAVAKAGTAKDVAAMLVELLTGAEDPAAVMEEFGQLVDWNPQLGTSLAKGMAASGAIKTMQATYLALRQASSKAQAAETNSTSQLTAAA
jgi:hypothetical protein